MVLQLLVILIAIAYTMWKWEGLYSLVGRLALIVADALLVVDKVFGCVKVCNLCVALFNSKGESLFDRELIELAADTFRVVRSVCLCVSVCLYVYVCVSVCVHVCTCVYLQGLYSTVETATSYDMITSVGPIGQYITASLHVIAVAMSTNL